MFAIETKSRNKPLIYFIGLSAKPMCQDLDPETHTGYIIEKIINRLPAANSVKTNLVKFAPLDYKGKLRYPNLDEMEAGWNDLQIEINSRKPFLMVTLGQQVSSYLRGQMGIKPNKTLLPSNFEYESFLSNCNPNLMSVHHPSFVFVYRRKDVQLYVERVAQSISCLVTNGNN